MTYLARRTRNTTRSSTSSTVGQPSEAWLSSSRAFSSQFSTNGERVRESQPRTFYNSLFRSSLRSSICNVQRITSISRNYNFWSINRIWPIPKINLSKSRMWYKKHLKIHSSHTKTPQKSWPLSQLQTRKRRLWSTIPASRICSSKLTHSVTTCSSYRLLKASKRKLKTQRSAKRQWLHIKSLSIPLLFCLSSLAIISKRKISSRWLMALQLTSSSSEIQCTSTARKLRNASSQTLALLTSSSNSPPAVRARPILKAS